MQKEIQWEGGGMDVVIRLIDPEEELEEKEEKIREEEEEAEDNEDAIIGFDNIEKCKEWQNRQFRVFNSKYPNVKTDMPYVLDQDELNEKILGDLIIRPHPAQPLDHEMKINIEDKLNVDFFNHWTNNSKINTLDYLFNKIRAGYYLKIQNLRNLFLRFDDYAPHLYK